MGIGDHAVAEVLADHFAIQGLFKTAITITHENDVLPGVRRYQGLGDVGIGADDADALRFGNLCHAAQCLAVTTHRQPVHIVLISAIRTCSSPMTAECGDLACAANSDTEWQYYNSGQIRMALRGCLKTN